MVSWDPSESAQNGISVSSAVFAGLMHTANAQKDHGMYAAQTAVAIARIYSLSACDAG